MQAKYISVEDFIQGQAPQFGLLLWHIRELILCSHPKTKERILFNTPMFAVKKEFCYVGTIKAKTGIEIGFHRGFQMSNQQGLLDAKGRKYIAGISFKSLDDLKEKEEAFLEIIQEAIILDEINEKSIFAEVLNAGKKRRPVSIQ
jgi:hypothetical protein